MAPKKRHKRRKRTVSLATTPSPRAHSLLDRYGPAKKRARREEPRVQAVVIDDPYAADFPAALRDRPAATKARNDGYAEWVAPPRRPIEVLASARDVVADMFARRTIDKAMFLAARHYEQTYDTAMSLKIKTVDPSMPPISGGTGGNMIDAVRDARVIMRRMNRRLAKVYGSEAVTLVREVLGAGLTIQRVATTRGEGTKTGRLYWGRLFGRCLRELAETSGFAVRGAYRNRAREAERIEKARRRAEKRERAEAKKPKRKRGERKK